MGIYFHKKSTKSKVKSQKKTIHTMVKKKKGKGMKKSKKGKKKKEYLPTPYTIYPFEDPDECTPIAELKCRLIGPNNHLLEDTFEMMITKKVRELVDKIKAIHAGSILGVKLCKDKWNEEEILDE